MTFRQLTSAQNLLVVCLITVWLTISIVLFTLDVQPDTKAVTFGVVTFVLTLVYYTAGWLRNMQEQRSYKRFTERSNVTATAAPFGKTQLHFASYRALPAGDRHHGLRYGTENEITVSVDGENQKVKIAVFEWWYETKSSRSRDHFTRKSVIATAIELPVYVPARIVIRPRFATSVRNQASFQMESSEFNSRFVVDTTVDRNYMVKLVDAAMQSTFVSLLEGRHFHMENELVIIVGEPSHQDRSLKGKIGFLPAALMDAQQVIRAIPAQFWRASSRQNEQIERRRVSGKG